MAVTETFFSVAVCDMQRATHFYVEALGASVAFGSADWSSLWIAGVRLGLFRRPGHQPAQVGLHFVVSDLDGVRALIQGAGGQVGSPSEVAPGVVVVSATDTEGNTFTLRQG